MQRLGAVFIAICMVAISASIGAILHFKFGLSIPEASPISFGVLLTLLLVHYQISRMRDRMVMDEQMDDMARLKLALTKELQDARALVTNLESNLSSRMEKEIEPLLAELDVIGSIVKQLAESCAELDEQVQKDDKRIGAFDEKLAKATGSVKELETLLRENLSALAAKSERISIERSQRAAPQTYADEQEFELQQSAYEPSEEPYAQAGYGQQEAFDESYNEPLPYEAPVQDIRTEPAKEPVKIKASDEAAVRRALALGDIELHMQPVVTLPMRKPASYETLTRLLAEDGSILTPDIFLPVCRKNNFMPMLDRLAINEAFRLLRRLADRGRAVDIFCNLSLSSVSDSDFFALLRDLFDDNKDLAQHVILEFSHSDLVKFCILEDETLKMLNTMGFRFSVDQITDLSVDFDQIARKGIRFAKVAAPILTHRDAKKGLDIHPADFSRVLARKGIDLVVTHVESEHDLVRLVDFNIHYAQGDHFAPARALKASNVTVNNTENGGASAMTQAPEARAGSAPSARQSSPEQNTNGQNRDTQAARKEAVQRAVRDFVMNGGNQPIAQADRQPSQQTMPQQPRQQAAPAPAPSSSPARTLGENPRIAQALRAMAMDDNNNSETRDHFRSVLAEAAGLLDPEGEQMIQQPRTIRRAPTPSANPSDRLPAAEDFGLRTGTDRGQYIDLSRT